MLALGANLMLLGGAIMAGAASIGLWNLNAWGKERATRACMLPIITGAVVGGAGVVLALVRWLG